MQQPSSRATRSGRRCSPATPTRAVTALELTGFDRCLPTLYVTGGAQGAQQINQVIAQALPWLLERVALFMSHDSTCS
ncbi:hypothetical protein GCM10009646_41030 [Streptomyces aureus]